MQGAKFDISNVHPIIAHVKDDNLALEDPSKTSAKIFISGDLTYALVDKKTSVETVKYLSGAAKSPDSMVTLYIKLKSTT